MIGSARMRSRSLLTLSLLMLALGNNLNAATAQVQVANAGFNFSPSSVSIQAGDTVEWIWKGSKDLADHANGERADTSTRVHVEDLPKRLDIDPV